MENVFKQLYDSGEWTLTAEAGGESRSGLGSNLVHTETLRAELPALLANLEVTSMVDIPCGDHYWMSGVDLSGVRYVGADIVPEIVAHNARLYGSPTREFVVRDLSQDPVPDADLIFTRDCLQHLSYADVASCLANVARSNCTFFAATTFTGRASNRDISTGQWRPLNLNIEPFSLPEPLTLLNENCTEVYRVVIDGTERDLTYPDKCIAVWRVADLARGMAGTGR